MNNNSLFPLKSTVRILLSLLILAPEVALANEATGADDAPNHETKLGEVHVFGKRNAPQRYDATNLGEVRKVYQRLQREQVESIRDLVRYDPGIGVNESGGRGTSRGYAIRGVDKERVAVSVDGMESSLMLRRRDRNGANSASKSSGAQNEIEYENLKEVDIRKGSSSLESGSGALGGSVTASTKTIEDFLDEGQSFGGRLKTGFTSKDLRRVGVLGLAGRAGNFEGFLQYTYRKGHETKAHRNLYQGKVFIANQYDNVAEGPNGEKGRYLSANEVSGKLRQVPNPIDYNSGSLLSKFGWHLSPKHYIGAVIEHSKQNYDVREMFIPNYWDVNEAERIFTQADDQRVRYTPTRYYLDKHHNRRIGLEYQYQNNDENKAWLPDTASVHFDVRKLDISTHLLDLNCAPWPSIDRNCWPTEGGQIGRSHLTTLSENDKHFGFALNKQWQLNTSKYSARLRGGYNDADYRIKDEMSGLSLYRYSDGLKPTSTPYHDIHESPKIHGQKFFLALDNQLQLNDKLSFSGGIRFDRHIYSANPTAEQDELGYIIKRNIYNNWSWDTGVRYQLLEGLSLSYRNSSGFRVPSIIEQLGADFGIDDKAVFRQTHAPKAETSINNEIGVAWQSPVLSLSASYFLTNYRNLISLARIGTGDEIYYNLNNVKTHGFDVGARVDMNSLWNKLPAGLELFATASKTSASQPQLPQGYSLVSSYTLDSIQPLRVVYGVSYNEPSDRWGVKFATTYSSGKSASELMGYSKQGGLDTYGNKYDIQTRRWLIADLTGHYRFNKNSVLRLGIYNLFNYKYLTWESARQTGYGLDARIAQDNYRALAAPGRNFLVNFEMKF